MIMIIIIIIIISQILWKHLVSEVVGWMFVNVFRCEVT